MRVNGLEDLALSEVELPPQIQEQLQRLQQMQQTLQAVVTQKQQLEFELAEAERAIEELEKASEDAPVFRMVGSILVRASKDKLLTDLKEKKEMLNTRVMILGKQEERARSRIKEMQEKLQERLKAQGPAEGPPL
ncbi:MAG: prefoldin subunit beta [Candidatus Bathyarchaeia archaeon]